MPRNKVRDIRSLFATIEVVMRGIPAKHYVAKSCNASKYLLVMPRCSTSFRSQCDHLPVWVHPPWRFRACLQPSDCISCLAAVSRHPSRKTLQVAVLCAQWVGTRSEWLLDKSRSAPSFYLSGGGVEGERDGKEGGGGSGSSFATSPISPAAQSLPYPPITPTVTFMHFPFTNALLCIAFWTTTTSFPT